MFKYGDKVYIKDGSQLEGIEGLIVRLSDDQAAEILLDKEILITVKLNGLQLAS